MSDHDRRLNPSVKDEDLYTLSQQQLKDIKEKERRLDELKRMDDVTVQKRVWLKIFLSCLFMNLVFIAFAVYGGMVHGF